MTRIGLLRHPPVLVAPGRCYGRADLPLAPCWQAGMPALAAALRRIDPRVVHTSPLGRCRLPAEALGRLLARLGEASLALARLFEAHVNTLQLILRYGTPAQAAAAPGRG